MQLVCEIKPCSGVKYRKSINDCRRNTPSAEQTV